MTTKHVQQRVPVVTTTLKCVDTNRFEWHKSNLANKLFMRTCGCLKDKFLHYLFGLIPSKNPFIPKPLGVLTEQMTFLFLYEILIWSQFATKFIFRP